MPMPKPMSSESQNAFMTRCMGDSMMTDDYPDHDQRVAVCMQQWDKGKADNSIARKKFTGIELKKEKPGSFTAKIATLKVIDHDGDVTLPGAFPNGKSIPISAYQHGSWMGALPVGKGVIREEGDSVFVDGEFFLDTDAGEQHYKTVKNMPELTEWSYGFRVTEIDEDSEWNENPKVWRVMKRLDVYEASPVLKGAGIGTGTPAIKSDNNHGTPLADELDAALAAVSNVSARVKSLADLRRADGKKAMSDSTTDRVRRLMSQMGGMMRDMQEMMDEMESEDGKAASPVEGRAELLESIKVFQRTFGGN